MTDQSKQRQGEQSPWLSALHIEPTDIPATGVERRQFFVRKLFGPESRDLLFLVCDEEDKWGTSLKVLDVFSVEAETVLREEGAYLGGCSEDSVMGAVEGKGQMTALERLGHAAEKLTKKGVSAWGLKEVETVRIELADDIKTAMNTAFEGTDMPEVVAIVRVHSTIDTNSNSGSDVFDSDSDIDMFDQSARDIDMVSVSGSDTNLIGKSGSEMDLDGVNDIGQTFDIRETQAYACKLSTRKQASDAFEGRPVFFEVSMYPNLSE